MPATRWGRLPVWLAAVLTPLRYAPLYATDLNAMKPLASLAPLRHCAKRVRKGRYEIMGTSHGGGGEGHGRPVTTLRVTPTGGLYFLVESCPSIHDMEYQNTVRPACKGH